MNYLGLLNAVIHIIGGIILLMNINNKSWWLRNRKIIGVIVLLVAVFSIIRLF